MMTLRRFFLEDMEEGAESLLLTGTEFRHLSEVLRLGEGTEVELFNGRGLTCRAVIEEITKGSAMLKPTTWSNDINEAAIKITLIQGMTKAMKPELVVEKATELGVSKVFFYEAKRSVFKRGLLKDDKKLVRLKKKAVAAVKQCGRSMVPEVDFIDFNDALKQSGSHMIVLHEEERGRSLKDILSGIKDAESLKDIVILVGPEGGFTGGELEEINSSGFITAGLGPRVLRAETAAITVVSIIQYVLGDMG
jgi:16S rRNA (uracil1498-N3)-methyltransferase